LPETVPAETGRKDTPDNIPADFSMDGAVVRVLMRGGTYRNHDFDGGGSESGDVVLDAVYNRTRTVEERLDLKFDPLFFEGGYKDFGTQMEKDVLAGDDSWQIIFATSNASISMSRDYLFRDLSNNKYLDFDQPWWWKGAMETLSIDGKKIRYLIGDIALNNYLKAGAMYFNQDILSANGYDTEELYKTVIDRKWTYDKLAEMCQTVYRDLNGDGAVNDGDLYGLYLDSTESLQHMEYTVGVRHYTRSPEGYPVMDYDTDRAETAIQKLQSLVYETHGNAYLSVTENMGRVFREGKSAFFLWRFESVFEPAFREMEADFGIIPYPMLDEEQQEYETIIHNSSNSVTVPVTCRNPDEIGAVIEALCAESYRTVVEPFYETALKTKYTRDSFSAQCIDIIRNVAVKNFMYEYNGVVGGGRMIREQLQNNSNTFSSSYAAQVSVTNQKIRDMVDKFNKLESENNG